MLESKVTAEIGTLRCKRDWIGLRVRTLRDMTTSLGRIPTGSLAVVTDSYGGLRLETDKCKSCGVQFRISKVHERDVAIIGRDEKTTARLSYRRRRRR